jgi:hypothetical protein
MCSSRGNEALIDFGFSTLRSSAADRFLVSLATEDGRTSDFGFRTEPPHIGAYKTFRQTEIRDVRLICGVDQDVRRFEIAVEHAVLVCVFDRSSDAPDVGRGAFRRQRLFAHQFAKAGAFHIVHRKKRLAHMFTDFMNRHDVRMLQSCRGARLGAKAFDELPP